VINFIHHNVDRIEQQDKLGPTE